MRSCMYDMCGRKIMDAIIVNADQIRPITPNMNDANSTLQEEQPFDFAIILWFLVFNLSICTSGKDRLFIHTKCDFLNGCVKVAFRVSHLNYLSTYIHVPSKKTQVAMTSLLPSAY